MLQAMMLTTLFIIYGEPGAAGVGSSILLTYFGGAIQHLIQDFLDLTPKKHGICNSAVLGMYLHLSVFGYLH